jgi:hypothetical protein
MKKFNALIKIIYFVFFIYFSMTGPFKPFANWDMLAYVGSAKSLLNDSMNLREDSLVDVKNYVSVNQFQRFVQGNNYVETVASDDQAFQEQLPAYKLKTFYILLISLISLLIGNISFSSVIVSSISFFIIGNTLFLMKPNSIKLQNIYLIFILLVMYLGEPKFILFCNVATPDSLAIALTLLGLHFLISNKKLFISILFFSLAILARPDSVVTYLCFIPLIYKIKNEIFTNLRLFSYALIPFLTYVISSYFFPGFGLKELIIFTIKGPFPNIMNIDTSNFWEIYFKALKNDFVSMFSLTRFSLFFFFNLMFLYLLKKEVAFFILLATLTNIILKIILFPNFDYGYGERFFCTSYFVIIYSIFNSRFFVKSRM